MLPNDGSDDTFGFVFCEISLVPLFPRDCKYDPPYSDDLLISSISMYTQMSDQYKDFYSLVKTKAYFGSKDGKSKKQNKYAKKPII